MYTTALLAQIVESMTASEHVVNDQALTSPPPIDLRTVAPTPSRCARDSTNLSTLREVKLILLSLLWLLARLLLLLLLLLLMQDEAKATE
jgi:hypothetical protein